MLEVLSGIFRHPAQPPGDDMPGTVSASSRRFWRDSSGRFRQRPEQPPVPEIDDILSLSDAVVSIVASSRPIGRDVTREQAMMPRNRPRSAEAAPFVNEVSFECRPDCRCITCHPYEPPWWRTRRNRRR